MNQNIEQILQDIYSVDESLRAHEGKLREIISALLSNRPEFGADPEFRQSLRNELLTRIHQLKLSGAANIKTNFFASFMQNKFYPAGAVIVAVLAVAYIMFGPQTPSGEFALAPKSTKVADMAFGPLSGGAQGEAVPMGRGGGGGSAAFSARPQSGGGGGMAYDMTMPAPEYLVYEYVYDGEPLELSESTVEVLRRMKGNLSPASSIVRNLGISGVNLNTFTGLGVHSVNLSENREYGYSVFVDFYEGMISINQNWLYWPNPMAECRDDACFEKWRVRADQVMPDAEAIAIADAFLAERGIDRSAFGQPEVQNDWRVMYERAPVQERLAMWVPEQLNVIYPLNVDGKIVYDEGAGWKSGMTVSVDIRTKKAANLYNLSTQNYERSSYEAETDFSKVLEAVKRGGTYPAYRPDGATIRQIKVGTPVEGYMRTWVQQGLQAMELLVPALVFPVTSNPDPNAFQVKHVVIPLAKELINRQPVGMGGPIEIMTVPPQVMSDGIEE